MTLTEFLLARIAEDEANYRAAWFDTGDIDPARVLAECEAKRRIVDEHSQYAESAGMFSTQEEGRSVTTLRLLALPYADHPDYDETWRP